MDSAFDSLVDADALEAELEECSELLPEVLWDELELPEEAASSLDEAEEPDVLPEEAPDEDNNKLMLQTMKFQVKRTCRFRCALAVAAPNGKILLESDGICDGMLLHEPLGTEGFGYDPLFWSTELHKGMGEATMQEKNKISHRGKAIKKLVANWGKMK